MHLRGWYWSKKTPDLRHNPWSTSHTILWQPVFKINSSNAAHKDTVLLPCNASWSTQKPCSVPDLEMESRMLPDLVEVDHQHGQWELTEAFFPQQLWVICVEFLCWWLGSGKHELFLSSFRELINYPYGGILRIFKDNQTLDLVNAVIKYNPSHINSQLTVIAFVSVWVLCVVFS